MAVDNIASKIPDVWYDIYVRLLPGAFFCITAFLVIKGRVPNLTLSTGLLFFMFGYVIGHAAQPLNAALTHWLSKKLRIEAMNDNVMARQLVGSESRDALIISKQWAEISSMFAFATFSVALAALTALGPKPWLRWELDPVSPSLQCALLLILSALFFLAAWGRAKRLEARLKRHIARAAPLPAATV